MGVFRPVRLPLLINCLRNKLKWDPNTRRAGPQCKLHTSTLLIGASMEEKKEEKKSNITWRRRFGSASVQQWQFSLQSKIEGGFTDAGTFTKAFSALEGNLKLHAEPCRQGPTRETTGGVLNDSSAFWKSGSLKLKTNKNKLARLASTLIFGWAAKNARRSIRQNATRRFWTLKATLKNNRGR